jgi:hypothetical protein
VQVDDTAKKVPVFVRAIIIPLTTINPPFEASAPVLVSTVKLLVAVGGGVEVPAILLEPSELQLVANPAIQAGTKTVAAPNPTLAKNSFLVMVNKF